MDILKTLTKEHRMFEKLIERLEHSLALEEPLARSEVRDALLVLLPALDRHEDIEHIIFSGPAAGPAAAEVEVERQAIQSLRREVLDAVQAHDEAPFEKLKSLTVQFAEKLRRHFASKETKLWPEHRGSPSRDRSAKLQLAVMEREMRENWGLIAQYLGRFP